MTIVRPGVHSSTLATVGRNPSIHSKGSELGLAEILCSGLWRVQPSRLRDIIHLSHGAPPRYLCVQRRARFLTRQQSSRVHMIHDTVLGPSCPFGRTHKCIAVSHKEAGGDASQTELIILHQDEENDQGDNRHPHPTSSNAHFGARSGPE